MNNKPNTDEATTLVHSGITQMEAGAAIPLLAGGTPVKVDSSGRAVPVGTSGVCIGYALEAASASGVITTVLLIPSATPLASVVTGDQTNIAVVATADATDLASAVALANANKAKINAIIAMLVTAGIIAAP